MQTHTTERAERWGLPSFKVIRGAFAWSQFSQSSHILFTFIMHTQMCQCFWSKRRGSQNVFVFNTHVLPWHSGSCRGRNPVPGACIDPCGRPPRQTKLIRREDIIGRKCKKGIWEKKWSCHWQHRGKAHHHTRVRAVEIMEGGQNGSPVSPAQRLPQCVGATEGVPILANAAGTHQLASPQIAKHLHCCHCWELLPMHICIAHLHRCVLLLFVSTPEVPKLLDINFKIFIGRLIKAGAQIVWPMRDF